MAELLIVIYMIIFPITVLVLLFKIINKLEEEKENKKSEELKIKRKHTYVKPTSHQNVFNGKNTAYNLYKNQNGLYEPMIPSKGINLKDKEK